MEFYGPLKKFTKLDTIITVLVSLGKNILGFKNGSGMSLECHKMDAR